MKKSTWIALGLGLAVFTAGPARSATDVQTITTDVDINSLFRVDASVPNFSFGAVDPGGQSGDQTTTLTTFSNHGLEWTLKLHGFPLTSGGNTIPVTALNARTWGGAGIHTPPPFTNFQLDGTDQLIYTADSTEYDTGTGGVDTFLTAFLIVPGNQQPGTYAGTMDVILSDSF